MIYALPGMAADSRMYPEPWSSLPGFSVLDWSPYSLQANIPDLAKAVCEAAPIQDGDTLVGSSLGGMVACEIVKLRKIPVLFLIGSALHKEEVNRILTVLHPLARVTPFDWLRLSAGKVDALWTRMFADSEPSFVRAMCAAIFEWPGLEPSDYPGTKIYRIHGRFDPIIPLQSQTQVDLVLNGRHLIAVSHAQECVEFVRTHLYPTGSRRPSMQ